MNKKRNLRFVETEILLFEELFKRLAENKPARLTVKDLCEACGIHRTSFYLHFRNIRELMEGAGVYLMLRFDPDEGLAGLFEFIRENRAFFLPFLSSGHELALGDGSDYPHIFHRAGLSAAAREWLRKGCPETGKELAGILAEECRLEL